MRVGDVYVNPRGQKYRVVRFEKHGSNDVVLQGDRTSGEDRAVSSLMFPENGWRLVRAGYGPEAPE